MDELEGVGVEGLAGEGDGFGVGASVDFVADDRMAQGA